MKLDLIFSKIFIALTSLAFFNLTNAQDLVSNELIELFPAPQKSIDYSKPLKNSNNEAEFLISSVFLFYKTFISSQDKPSCIFTPSCSVYSVQAFKKKGIFLGWIYTFDRLSRCHPLVSPNQYPIDNKKQRYYDPVE
jgi:putative membrane protein insertion efficiency factor